MEVILQVSTDTEEIETNLNSDRSSSASGPIQKASATEGERSACGNDDLTRRAGLFLARSGEIRPTARVPLKAAIRMA
jgi:hypothetical protein